MDFTPIKEHNRLALLRVLATLFAMIGLISGGMVAVLPRHLRLKVLRLLRPLESALRRLVVVEAQGMIVEPPAARDRPYSKNTKAPPRKSERAPSFPLVEPLQRTTPPAPPYAPGPGPRIFCFDGFDPVIEAPPPAPSADDEMDARAVCRRLLALEAALNDLSKTARRLALWQARQDAAPPRTGRTRSLRPGRPPGFRERVRHEVDEILRECHDLALRALVPPDTS